MKKIVMFVESGENSLDKIRECLPDQEYTVYGCEYGEQQIIEAVSEHNPQLMILEISAEEGRMTADTALSLKERLDLPFLFMVSRKENAHWDRFRKALPHGLINSPFRESEFLNAVEMAFHRISMEKRLKDEEQWISLLVSGVGDAVITTDNAGRITFVNDEAEQLSGWSFEDSLERPFTDVFHVINDKESTDIINPLQTVFEKGIVIGISQKEVLVDRFGVEKPVDYVILRILDSNNNIIGAMITFGNSANRRLHFESFDNYEIQLREIVENAVDIIFMTDRQGQIHYINPVVTKTLGFEVNEAVGKHYTFFFHPDYSEQVDRIIKESVRDLKNNIYLEFPVLHSDGSTIWMSHNIKHFYSEGSWLKSQNVMRDITQVKSLISDIESAKRDAEIANRSKTIFIANVSHEIRTPLNAVLGYTQLLQMEEAGSLTEKQMEFLGVIHENSTYLLEMLNNVLDLAKIDSGKLNIHKSSFDLQNAIDKMTHTLRAPAEEKGIRLSTALEPDLGILYADEVKVKQIIYNLISNAIKFSSEGMEIVIAARAKNSNAVIEVRDTGIGIDESDRVRIFDSFEQAGSTNGPSHTGTGLGLAITRKLVEIHGGSISVESTPGQGSTFTVILPGLSWPEQKDASAEELELPDAFIETGKTGPANILIVDDDRTNRRMLEMLLTAKNYRTTSTDRGDTALEMLEREKFDLVLMDIQLEGMSGSETLARIRESSNKEIPVIAVTAHALEDDRKKYLMQGFDGYISKPIDLKRLLLEVDFFTR